MANFMLNIYLWIGLTFLFLVISGLLVIFIIVLSKKTHAIVEIKSWMKGYPIALFFQDNRYCDMQPVKVEGGIVQSKEFGSFIVNEKATYIDKVTKNILIPFDASFGASINVRAAKLVEDLHYVAKNEDELRKLRTAVANGEMGESDSIDAIKTSVTFGALKTMMTALIPHNIESKIQMEIANKMSGYGKVNIQSAVIAFVSIFGAICLGGLVLYLTLK